MCSAKYTWDRWYVDLICRHTQMSEGIFHHFKMLSTNNFINAATQPTIWGHHHITVIALKPHGEVTVWAHSDIKLKHHIDLTVTSQWWTHPDLTPWHHNVLKQFSPSDITISSHNLWQTFVVYLYYHSLTMLVSCVISNELCPKSNTPIFSDLQYSPLTNMHLFWSGRCVFLHVITTPACSHVCYWCVPWCDTSQCEIHVTSMWYHRYGIIVWDVCDITVLVSWSHMLTRHPFWGVAFLLCCRCQRWAAVNEIMCRSGSRTWLHTSYSVVMAGIVLPVWISVAFVVSMSWYRE